MIRKIILTVFFVFLFFYSSRQNSLASCVPPSNIGSPARPSCGISGKPYNCIDPATGYPMACCDLPADCPYDGNPTSVGSAKNLSVFCDANGIATDKINYWIFTGLGCIPFWVGPFTAKILAWASLGNLGIAFGLILVAAFLFITSGGNSKKIQAAKELIFSAMGGVFLVIVSLVILNYLGVNVLKINFLGFRLNPDFGSLGTVDTPAPLPINCCSGLGCPTGNSPTLYATCPDIACKWICPIPGATATPKPPTATPQPFPTNLPTATPKPPTATPTPKYYACCVSLPASEGLKCGSPCHWDPTGDGTGYNVDCEQLKTSCGNGQWICEIVNPSDPILPGICTNNTYCPDPGSIPSMCAVTL